MPNPMTPRREPPKWMEEWMVAMLRAEKIEPADVVAVNIEQNLHQPAYVNVEMKRRFDFAPYAQSHHEARIKKAAEEAARRRRELILTLAKGDGKGQEFKDLMTDQDQFLRAEVLYGNQADEMIKSGWKRSG